MSNNKKFKNISELNHLFGVGQEVYFSCLIPKYDWFNKNFSILELIEPIQLKITKHKLIPDNLDKSDSIIISKLRMTEIIRKYIFNITLEYDNTIKLIVYEDRNKEITILHESNKIIGYFKDEVESEFMRLIITTKRNLEYDKEETIIISDENYERFLELYSEAIELYPEEIIKIHDTTNLL